MSAIRVPTSVTGSLAALALLSVVPTAAESQTNQSQHHSFRVVTVAENLANPWSMAFLPNGDMLFTERSGRLRVIRNGRLLSNPVPGVPEVRAQGQGGLLDIVLHPDFETNRLIYMSYSKPNGDENVSGAAGSSEATTAIARARFENDQLTNFEEIFEAQAWATGNAHFGSRIQFDADGYLFFTVGDRGASPVDGPRDAHPAQNLSNHRGTVIRLHDDGRVPSDNPFVGRAEARPEIWSYGHRSPQGLFIHPVTGDIWEGEHGPQGGDEVNLIVRGANFGWPVIGEGVNYGGGQIHDSNRRPGMEAPRHFWVPSIATSGMLIYLGDEFPEWRGSMFVGGLSGQQLARLEMEGQRIVSEETLLEGLGRVRDIRQGPDGFIYIAIDGQNGALTPILRLEPVAED